MEPVSRFKIVVSPNEAAVEVQLNQLHSDYVPLMMTCVDNQLVVLLERTHAKHQNRKK